MKRALLSCLFLTPALAQGKPPGWEVNAPPGQAATVPIKVSQGTWMSLDVSPDGKTIVFDLLGDLYLLDINGGKARSLTSGVAWDMQPTFSPDGRSIAFTSDRGGGDNLWVIPSNGGQAKPVTKESFRLLNQPAWDPSGSFIAGRKHFTGTRSLGAGEIWSYSAEGNSDGAPMTKRSNDQLDLGEPAFSADGRYLYYSLDATGGSSFQYNKDPNAGIYAIDRVDRASGRIERIAGGPGGACRPVPSPDGKRLAFVKRVRGKTVLMVKELESGQEVPIFDGLDRDMQETWAIHGVYPRFDWMPNSSDVVFWAQGRLWRISAEPGRAIREIPFSVEDSRQIRGAVRFPVKVAPAQLEVKALRGPVLSGDGRQVVFSALGKLWRTSSGGGAPSRVTSSQSGHESHPRWVSGDQALLYSHWSDAEGGSLRLRQISSGEEKVLVREGRFAEAALSPDGARLVYRKLGKNSLFSPRHTQSPGLYLKDLTRPDSEPRLLDIRGSHPHFGTDSDVVFFNRSAESTSLMRKNLTTGEERILYEGKDLAEITLSPDGQRGFFLDNFDLYTFDATLTGRIVELGAKLKNVPTRKLSSDIGAYFPSWNRSGELTWSVGPFLFQEKTKEAPVSLGWNQAAWKPSAETTVALVGGQVVSMKGDQVIPGGTVLVRGDRIAAVGNASEVGVPPGATVVDCRGKTVLPGLIDVHWHGAFSDGEVMPETNWGTLSSLSFGVTTLHDPSNDTATVFTAKELQQSGELIAPRVFSTGTILYGAKAPGYYAAVDSLADAEGHLKRLKAWGAISVKSYNQPRRDQRQQILEAARRHHMMVVPEGGSLLEHNLNMVVDGHTGIEHALPTAEIYDDVVALWSGTSVGYTPTLGVAYGGLWGENFWYVETDVWADQRLNQFVPREVIDATSRRRVKVPDEEHNHINASRGAYKLSQAGVRVQLGAHGQREGLAAHWELAMLVQGGMTPHQALRCGTLNGARYLGMDGDLGSLEPGKLADIIVVEGDVLSDIAQSKLVETTILGGRVFEAASMKELSPKAGAEPKVWWR